MLRVCRETVSKSRMLHRCQTAVSKELDIPGDVEGESAVQATGKTSRKWQPTCNMLLGVLLVVAMLPIVLLGNFISREANEERHISIPDALRAFPKAAISYASIWDLPMLSAETLSKLESITLVLSCSEDVQYEATLKTTGSYHRLDSDVVALTVLTEEGDIVIDRKSRVGVARVSGEICLFIEDRPHSTASARVASHDTYFSGGNRIHSTAPEDTASKARQHVSTSSEQSAYARLAMLPEDAVYFQKPDSHPRDYHSLYIHGTFYDIAAQHSLEVWLYYNSSDTLANINTSSSRDFGQGSRMLIRESEAYGILTDFDRSLDFVYDLELQLTECRKTSQSSSSAALVQHASFGEVSAVSSDKSSAFIIHATKYDLADPPAFLAFPADEQCIALSGSRTASLGASLTGQASKGNRRRRLQANASTPFGNYTYSRNATCQPQELWEASLAAYEGNSTDEEREAESGWKTWRSCKYDNAFARFLFKERESTENGTLAVVVLSIAGSDDLLDWLNNVAFSSTQITFDANYSEADGARTGYVHGGFARYQQLLDECIDFHRNELRTIHGFELSYIVGHSLGGAAATIYTQVSGEATHGLVTFGAPKTRYGASCQVRGTRYFHEDDIVPSSLPFDILGALSHDVEESWRLYEERCLSWTNFWGQQICFPWNFGTLKKVEKATDCAATSSNDLGALLDTSYHFVYGDYSINTLSSLV
mmetsp:Transcript_24647/g.51599  ORF Transcript_24647/g.51599 Transcript_24647/m.51599 type:complete len:710 (-) Transcript_24647:516-2645(-)